MLNPFELFLDDQITSGDQMTAVDVHFVWEEMEKERSEEEHSHGTIQDLIFMPP